jgi:pyridoxal phosphate enzyme (YggS family)
VGVGDLGERIARLRARILAACEACGRSPDEVELLPVSKRQSLELIRGAQALGFTRFGENYVQEGSAKALALPEARFLLIGPLQRNKAKPALQNFHEIYTLDRPDLGERLRRLAEELDVVRPVWVQLELWEEATKAGGCSSAEIPAVIAALGSDPRLPLQGFMAIPPPGAAEAFLDAAQVRSEWQQRLGRPLKLSLGMSDDLEEAIAAGSDQVRIGTAFFGERA